jgi:glycosyltransferase involved in cell wall biosynthesis
MRVLHILNELRPSGAETMLYAAAREWAKHDIECDILTTGVQTGVFAPRLRGAGYGLLHLPYKKSASFVFRLRSLIASGCYDVVHNHAERANLLVGLAGLAARCPRLVRTVHATFQHRGALRLRVRCERLMLRALGVSYVAVAPGVKENEFARFGNPTQVIVNWYDSHRFRAPCAAGRGAARKRFSLSDGDFVVASVGNCADVKNHSALLQALATNGLGGTVYLHAGIEQADRREQALADRLGVADRVRFLGHQEDVEPLLHAADVFVMPSLREGLPLAAVEALAVGLPTVLSDVPGLRDFRRYFDNLYYVDPTPTAIAAAVEAIRDLSENARRRLAADYSRSASTVFGMARGVAQYARLYRGRVPSPACADGTLAIDAERPG